MSTTFKHVLVPVDFSDDAERAVSTALQLFSSQAEKITLLTICEVISNRHAEVGDEINDIITKTVQQKTHDFVQPYTEKYKNIDVCIKKGHAAQQILAASEDLGADLIVMGSQGRGSIARVFFGSTTYDVSRKAKCSVFVIRA
jgi:nucleotide-binding universal stress UspA family protein